MRIQPRLYETTKKTWVRRINGVRFQFEAVYMEDTVTITVFKRRFENRPIMVHKIQLQKDGS